VGVAAISMARVPSGNSQKTESEVSLTFVLLHHSHFIFTYSTPYYLVGSEGLVAALGS
jgi:hypothetical protein